MTFIHSSYRRFVAILLSAIVATTAGTIVITQQTANAAVSSCTSYTDVICMWETKNHGDYGGRIFRVNIKDHIYNYCVTPSKGTPYALWINNSASSLMIRTADTRNYITIGSTRYYVTMSVYDSSNCTGNAWNFQSNGTKDALNLYNFIWRPSGVRLDNRISSYKVNLTKV